MAQILGSSTFIPAASERLLCRCCVAATVQVSVILGTNNAIEFDPLQGTSSRLPGLSPLTLTARLVQTLAALSAFGDLILVSRNSQKSSSSNHINSEQ